MAYTPYTQSPFQRGNGPLVSILLPTRGRCKGLYDSISSLHNLDSNHEWLEYIIKVDDDDHESIAMCNEISKVIPRFQVIISPRGNGYADMHHWVNQMASKATGDWIILFNDDVEMLTEHWDIHLFRMTPPDMWNAYKELHIGNLVIQTVNHPGASGLFFLRRKVYDILGRISASPHNDTYITTMMAMVDCQWHTNGIQVKHNSDTEDQTRQDGQHARDSGEYTTLSHAIRRAKLTDALKLLDYMEKHHVLRQP